MARVYVSIGSNVDRERNIRACLQALQAAFGELQVSTVYRSAAVGFQGDDFFNLVVGFDTATDVESLAAQMRDIEAAQGRRRNNQRFASRTLDLDILLYDDLVSQEDSLRIPREDITQYAFVLLPLAELAGERLHPQLKVTFTDLWQDFTARHDTNLVPVPFDMP